MKNVLDLYFKRKSFDLVLAQIWNVPTGTLEDDLKALYELEYKRSMIMSHGFSGVPERRDNIIDGLTEKLGEVIENLKGVLDATFKDWLGTHALLSPETWAEKRISDIEEYARGAFDQAVSEYARYTGDGRKHETILEELVNDAVSRLSEFPSLKKLVDLLMEDEMNRRYDELGEEGYEEFGRMVRMEFKNEEEAEEYISNLTSKDVDLGELMVSGGHAGFFDMVEKYADARGLAKEFYKNFVFPVWFAHWKEQGIEETRNTIQNIYDRLQSVSVNNTGNAIAVINLAINASHQTGSMMDYISSNANTDLSGGQIIELLDKLSAGTDVEEWNQELREVGVNI
jgi:hypothetical protein